MMVVFTVRTLISVSLIVSRTRRCDYASLMGAFVMVRGRAKRAVRTHATRLSWKPDVNRKQSVAARAATCIDALE